MSLFSSSSCVRQFHFDKFSEPNFQQQESDFLNNSEDSLHDSPTYTREFISSYRRKSSGPITLDSLEQPVREDCNQFLSLLDNTVKLVDRATECMITESYQQCVEISTTAIEQIEYLEKSLHLAPKDMDFKYLLETVDDCRYRAFSARATSNMELGAPRELIDSDIRASKNETEYVHDTRI